MGITTDSTLDGKVLHVTLSQAPFNLLKLEDLIKLRDSFVDAGNPHSNVRAVVISSSVPGVFSMGLDPIELLPMTPKERAIHFQMLAQMNAAALSSGRPIICQVKGPAMAGGAVLAALADYRLFDFDKGKFCFSETKVNLPVPGFVQSLIRRAVHPNALFETAVMAKNFDAKASLECGFAHALCATQEDFDTKTQDLLKKIIRLDPEVLKATLVESNKAIIEETQQFQKNSTAFEYFLSDSYFGKGLKDVVGKK